MNSDLNHATRRLLQVVLDMLKLSDAELEKQGANYSGQKNPWRCEVQCVEAAWRAAHEAQAMLAELWPHGAPAPEINPTEFMKP